METVRFLPAGDRALSVELGQTVDPAVNARVRGLDRAVKREQLPGVVETVPSYRALLVYYEPETVSCAQLTAALAALVRGLDGQAVPPGDLVELPVCYGGDLGPDLPFVAQHTGQTEQEVVALHSGPDYLVYLLGFTPGFPYLGGMDPRIAAPRLATPRVKIPAGSVGIAGQQTGVYPLDSPGGWQLIGRTPVRLYDPGREQPILLAPGDRVRFRPVEKAEYETILDAVVRGTYVCTRHPGEERT